MGTYYSGEDTSLCTTTDDQGYPFGKWTATATYTSPTEIPAALCVNIYDEHGSTGRPSGNAIDFSPVRDGDNSIQTNDFNPASQTDCLPRSALTGGSSPF